MRSVRRVCLKFLTEEGIGTKERPFCSRHFCDLVRVKVSERLMTDLLEESGRLCSSLMKKSSNVATLLCRLTLSNVYHQILCGNGVEGGECGWVVV